MKSSGGKMKVADRNELLEAMTKNIEDHVLRHNYLQAQAVSLVEAQATEKLQLHDEFIQDMERMEGLDRAIEFLPDAEEIQKRLLEGTGLTRPELSVLVSYAKISLTKELLKSEIPDDPGMQVWLYNYFPEQLRETYKDAINRHKLRREIIAMAVANSLINHLGPTFIQGAMKMTGMGCGDIVRAYIAVREIFGLRELWCEIESFDNKVCADVQMKAMIETALLAENAMTWLMTRERDNLKIESLVNTYKSPIVQLSKSLDGLLSDTLKDDLDQKIQVYTEQGFTKVLAKKLATLSVLKSGMDIVQISNALNNEPAAIAPVYFALGERFRLDWLQARAAEREVSDVWDREATESVLDKLCRVQAGLTEKILLDMKAQKVKKGEEVSLWSEKNADILKQVDPFFDKIERVGTLDLAVLMVAEQRLRHLYGG